MFTVLTRDLTDLLRNPRAFLGGLAGSTMCMAGVVGLTMFGPVDRDDDDADHADDELQMQFLAGVLVRKGEKPPEDPIPVKAIVDPSRAVDVPPDTTVTTDQDAPPTPPKPPPTPDKPKVPSKDPPTRTSPASPAPTRPRATTPTTTRRPPTSCPATRSARPTAGPTWPRTATRGPPPCSPRSTT
jgi:hypothetical protein